MKPAEFIQLAAKLVTQSELATSESRHRTAVSRAYYGAFHASNEVLEDCSMAVRRNAYGHQDVIDLLRQNSDPRARRLSRMLDDLRRQRIAADYRLDAEHFRTAIVARQSVELASEVLRLLTECRSDIATFREKFP